MLHAGLARLLVLWHVRDAGALSNRAVTHLSSPQDPKLDGKWKLLFTTSPGKDESQLACLFSSSQHE